MLLLKKILKIKVSKSGMLAMLFWVASLILAFIISPSSCFIWVPDTLLLLGFWPLLISHHARWWWIVFGVLNMVSGWFLGMSTVLPDDKFIQFHCVEIKKHLALYHPFMTWLLNGFVCVVIGLIILIVSLVKWLVRKTKSFLR